MSRFLSNNKSNIIVADSVEDVRKHIVGLLKNDYNVIDACDGEEVVNLLHEESKLIDLLIISSEIDKIDGFELLEIINRNDWIKNFPVVVIAKNNNNNELDRAFDLGATDFIAPPFYKNTVLKRVANSIALFKEKKRIINIVEWEVFKREKNNNKLIEILGHIVEFRNGDNGMHIFHMQAMTRVILKHINELTDKYHLTDSDIMTMSTAAALHDIGKINIREEILKKPEKLTDDEFEQVKKHTIIGADMIKGFQQYDDDPKSLVAIAYNICRYHHERYDGGGYPDGLVGDEIPLCAQAVAVAEVYDALVSKRCYRPAYSHEKAVSMILNGECGAFSPLMMQCLYEVKDELRAIFLDSDNYMPNNKKINIELDSDNKQVSTITADISADIWKKISFFTSDINEIQFVYDAVKRNVSINPWGSYYLKTNGFISDPNLKEQSFLGKSMVSKLRHMLFSTTPQKPNIRIDFEKKINDKTHKLRIIVKSLWSEDGAENYIGAMGRIYDINSRRFDDDPVQNFDSEELTEIIRQLSKIFDYVRMIDNRGRVVRISENGDKKWLFGKCYSCWNRDKRCEDCVVKAFDEKKTSTSTIRFIGDEMHQVFASKINVKGVDYVVELVHKVDNETLNKISHSKYTDMILHINKKLYRDVVTNAYNRRYYQDYICNLTDVVAVAMIDCDGFKQINDTYGHDSGDVALRSIVDAVKRTVGKEDIIIRFGGDEFLLISLTGERNQFFNKLKNAIDEVSKIYIPYLPNINLSITVGAVYNDDPIQDKVRQADALMYKGKMTGEKLFFE